MGNRLGLGPVFAREMIAGSRRWQPYAIRSAFVTALMLVLGAIWRVYLSQADLGLRELAGVGAQFFRLYAAVQMVMVTMMAPALAAGAICEEKARGTLLHILATDLDPGEVLAGKFAARLAAVLGLMTCGFPVLAASGLLGGIPYEAAAGAFLVTAGVAAVSCALGLTLSVWARKTHRALIGTYGALACWFLPYSLYLWFIQRAFRLGPLATPELELLTHFFQQTNPWVMMFAPTLDRRWLDAGLAEQAVFAGACGLAAAGLLLVARRHLRPVALAQANRPARRAAPGGTARLMARLPGPGLDGNPVLWREWHRKRPTRWTGRFWTLYVVASALASLAVLVNYYLAAGRAENPWLAAQVNTWGVVVGLLLLSVSAATALGEERDRGSLDVVMATPLSTRAIVWGKWWGTFAMVPRLAILPIWVGAGLALVGANFDLFALLVGLILAYAAAITSLGLALATWSPRVGRVVSQGVAVYGLATIAWPVQILAFRAYLPRDARFWDGMLLASPFFGVSELTRHAGRMAWQSTYDFDGRGAWDLRGWALTWIAFYAALAIVLMAWTLLSFDRRLGRIPDRPSRPRDDSPGSARPV